MKSTPRAFFEKLDKRIFINHPGIHVRADQVPFVCENLQDYVRGWADDPLFDCFRVWLAGKPVAFFALDFDVGRHTKYIDEQFGVCVLRGMIVDQGMQGLGIGNRIIELLPSFVRTTYPGIKKIYLTVNLRNESAIHVYRKNGFQPHHELYAGGSAGLQFVMHQEL